MKLVFLKKKMEAIEKDINCSIKKERTEQTIVPQKKEDHLSFYYY